MNRCLVFLILQILFVDLFVGLMDKYLNYLRVPISNACSSNEDGDLDDNQRMTMKICGGRGPC